MFEYDLNFTNDNYYFHSVVVVGKVVDIVAISRMVVGIKDIDHRVALVTVDLESIRIAEVDGTLELKAGIHYFRN